MAAKKKKKKKTRPRTGKRPAPRGSGADGSAAALPVLMAPPSEDAARVFTFTARTAGGGLQVVEAYFCVPDGLFRLRAQGTTRPQYVPWAQQMTRKAWPDMPQLPQRAVVPASLIDRKRWEIGVCMQRGRLGPEVDVDLGRRIGDRSGVIPPHPALALDLPEGPHPSVADLGRRPHRLRAFKHNGPLTMLRDQWQEYGGTGGRLISGGGRSLMEGAVGEWARQWGHEAILELLLDAAVFYAAVGDPEAAAAFRGLATAEDFGDRITTFLGAWADFHFAEIESRVS